jgi:hypothetical protein
LGAEEFYAAVVELFGLLIGFLGVFEGGMEIAMLDEVELVLGGVEAADFPGGGDDLFGEEKLDGGLGMQVGEVGAAEFEEEGRVFAGQDVVGGVEAEGGGVAGGAGFALGGLGAGGFLCVGAVGGQLALGASAPLRGVAKRRRRDFRFEI